MDGRRAWVGWVAEVWMWEEKSSEVSEEMGRKSSRGTSFIFVNLIKLSRNDFHPSSVFLPEFNEISVDFAHNVSRVLFMFNNSLKFCFSSKLRYFHLLFHLFALTYEKETKKIFCDWKFFFALFPTFSCLRVFLYFKTLLWVFQE